MARLLYLTFKIKKIIFRINLFFFLFFFCLILQIQLQTLFELILMNCFCLFNCFILKYLLTIIGFILLKNFLATYFVNYFRCIIFLLILLLLSLKSIFQINLFNLKLFELNFNIHIIFFICCNFSRIIFRPGYFQIFIGFNFYLL